MRHSNEFILNVWNKGRKVAGSNPDIWSKDDCGAWIKLSEYGNRGSQFGWEIDRIKTGKNDGEYVLSNCRPLQWQNNVEKSGGNLVCKIKAKRGAERRTNVSV